MQIGISTGFADRLNIDIFKALDIISKTPFKIVELWSVFYGKQKHFNWSSNEEIQKIKNLLNNYGIKVYSIHGPFSYQYEFASEEKNYVIKLVDDTKQIIQVAAELGAKCVVIHPVSSPNTSKHHLTFKEYQHKFNLVKSSISELIEFILKNKFDIRIAIENQLPHIMFAYFDELITLIEAINSKYLGICLDTSHAEMAYNNNTDEFIKNFVSAAKYVLTTHFSDTDGKTDAHLVPGEGKIQWYKFSEVVNKLNIGVPVILEILSLLEGKSIEETLNVCYKNVRLFLKDWW